jgi:hypothetical protein
VDHNDCQKGGGGFVLHQGKAHGGVVWCRGEQEDERMEISARAVAQVILMGHEMGRAEGELRGFIERLGNEEQAELVAIFWIGRGSFDAAEFAEARAVALREATVPTADYLFGSPHFADHLEAGAEALGLDVAGQGDDLL